MARLPPSTLHLPRGDWPTLLDGLSALFPQVGRDAWQARLRDGKVTDEQDRPLAAGDPWREGLRVRYRREVADEPPIPFEAQVLYRDAHLVVVDKPHFLPVAPSGRFVEQTLLARLVRQLDNPHLAPLHRLDRLTAGLVLFSADPASRAAYQALFRERRIDKHYEAIAPALPDVDFPLRYRSRLAPGEPFFRMREVAGEANSETLVDVLERRPAGWRYALRPVTGRKHQLRVQMAALGAPIRHDPLYPQLRERAAEDCRFALQLLARRLSFRDPLSGRMHCHESRRTLAWEDADG